MEKVNLKTPQLKKLVIKIFKKHGLNDSHAAISAEALINAELVGAYGHGLSRLKMYCDRINKKVINPKPKIKKTSIYDIPYFITDISKVSKFYNWKPKKNIFNIVKDTYNWLLDNKDEFLKK